MSNGNITGVATSIVDSLKQQPAVLALTLANMALLVFIFYALNGAAKFREAMLHQVLQNSAAIHALITTRSIECPK